MNRIYRDISSIVVLIIFSLLIWSSVTTEQSSIIVLALMLLVLFIANVFFIFIRQGANTIERTIYTFLFFISSSIVFSVLLADDHNMIVMIVYLLFQVLILGVFSTVLCKEFLIKKFDHKKQDFLLFTVSVILVVINFFTITNL